MKIVLFGGNGRTGQELLMQLLARGHEVTAVVQDPKRFDVHFDRLCIVRGDALKPETFGAALDRQNAILSVLGVTGFIHSLRPMTFYEQSTRAIISEMSKRDVRRLVLVGSVGVVHDPTTPIWYRTIVQQLLRHKYADMKRMEEAARQSGLDWTVVRAAQLVDGPLTQRYRVGSDGRLPNVTKVSRADLADFVARQADDRSHLGQAVALSY